MSERKRFEHLPNCTLTWNRARSLHLDDNFRARISGHVYAQPLYWHAPGSSSGTLFVATEDNVVHAIDAVSGKETWQRSLGKPVPRPCVIVETYKCLQIKISGVSA